MTPIKQQASDLISKLHGSWVKFKKLRNKKEFDYKQTNDFITCQEREDYLDTIFDIFYIILKDDLTQEEEEKWISRLKRCEKMSKSIS